MAFLRLVLHSLAMGFRECLRTTSTILVVYTVLGKVAIEPENTWDTRSLYLLLVFIEYPTPLDARVRANRYSHHHIPAITQTWISSFIHSISSTPFQSIFISIYTLLIYIKNARSQWNIFKKKVKNVFRCTLPIINQNFIDLKYLENS